MSISPNKLKVMTVVGTRPEIIRLSRVISKLDASCEHCLVHTGQNFDYELNKLFFEQLKLPDPNYFLNSAGKTSTETTGEIIKKIDPILAHFMPDAFLVLGDTNSCLSAIAAKKRKIPVFHMEAGNRCFDLRVPEETNRKIVDHISDINLPYSKIAREHLIREGMKSDQIIVTGSPMKEVLEFYKKEINDSKILEHLKLKKNKFFVVSCHREENVDDARNIQNLGKTLNCLADNYNIPIIVSLHPRTKLRISKNKIKFHEKVNLMKPLGFLDYIKLQQNAYCVLSDSGTISEEASILGFDALNLREAHERPEAMEEAAVMMTGLDPQHIIRCLTILKDPAANLNKINIPSDYNVMNVSDKVLKIILSYTNFIKRNNWGL